MAQVGLHQTKTLKYKIRDLLREFIEWRWKGLMLIFILVLYSAYISSEVTLPVSLPSMLDDHHTLGKSFDKESVSRIIGFATISYFLGKLINGFIVDRIGGKNCSLIVIACISCLTGTFGLVCWFLSISKIACSSHIWEIFVQVTLIVIWGANKFFMSAMWSSMTSLLSSWYDERLWGTMFGLLSTISRVSNALSGLFLSTLLSLGVQWQFLFIVSSLYAFFTFLIAFLISRIAYSKLKPIMGKKRIEVIQVYETPSPIENSHNQNTLPESSLLSDDDDSSSHNSSTDLISDNVVASEIGPKDTSEKEGSSIYESNENHKLMKKLEKSNLNHSTHHPLEEKNVIHVLIYFITSPRFWLIVIMQIGYQTIFELGNFLPIYFKEVKGLIQDGEAGRASLVFSFGSGLTVFASGIIYDRLLRLKFGRFIFMTAMCSAIVVIVSILWILPDLNTYITMVLVLILGLSFAPGYYVVMGVFTVSLGGKKHCGKLSSFIDCFAYIFASLFNFTGGIMIQRIGWDIFWFVILLISIINLICSVGYQLMELYLRYRHTKHANME